eukprot:XP_017451962.1 PREDICTED: putative malate dehydrogenase 1B isoform X5 [Rattus norvegicus]
MAGEKELTRELLKEPPPDKGKANCPYYAKAELLADYLQKNLPDFRIFKITKHPDEWEEWLEDVCERNMWDHRISPIIWRELLDRGGKGLLLGGYNEFLEHAQLYYGITSSMTTELMMIIAQENMETHTEQELDKENLKDLISPLQVWITSAGSRVCCHLIPLLLSGEVFGMQAEISLTLFDQEQRRECLSNIVMETENLASPVLRTVSFCTTVKDAFLQAEVIIILDDSTDEEVYNMESCLRSRVPLCRLYGYLIEKNAHKSVKVIVGGKSFLNLKTTLLIQYAPSLASNIIAVALGLEGQAKAVLARKMKTIPSSQFGIPEGIVFSMPVKFENGTWVVLTDLEDLSLSEKIINRLTGDLIQEKLVASGDLLTFQPIEEDPKDNTPSPTGLNEEKEQAESDSPLSVTEPNQMQEAWLEEEGNKDSDVKHGDREKLQPEQT